MPTKITHYLLLTHANADWLSLEVQRYIVEEGFQPLGSVAVSRDEISPTNVIYAQAVVRFEEAAK